MELYLIKQGYIFMALYLIKQGTHPHGVVLH